jgi:hypothetical protein
MLAIVMNLTPIKCGVKFVLLLFVGVLAERLLTFVNVENVIN